MRKRYGVIVVGGGHAGTEAAAASARAGVRTLLLSPDLSRLGQMSCNPAIGGVAKGVVAREVDALGGIMGRATDASRLQFRMLNQSKGPAVWGPRAQCDRALYPLAVRKALDELSELDLFQEMVSELLADGGRMCGVRTRGGLEFAADAVVVTAGTFLRGRIHVGESPRVEAGRAGEGASVDLAEGIEALGLGVARFKTGTPPRIDGRTVDFDRLERQDGDAVEYRFSSYVEEAIPEQRPCWITWAGAELKEVVQTNLERSALYGGEIAGRGPRYCPSIEDKVVRFPDAPRHQVFLEPEGLHTHELYVNGLSTSLPADVQLTFLRTVPGLESVQMTKIGYAIEYDYFPPAQLRHTLESRVVDGLYFAGQVNGTTGYEEAAGQGIVAGINAALRVRGDAPFVLERDQAYIGVLIDDLVTKGVDEPYRLFTSRAEFRLLLRQDNAVRRLGPLAHDRGLLTEMQARAMSDRLDLEDRVRVWFRDTNVSPEQANGVLEASGSSAVSAPTRVADLIKRPHVRARDLFSPGDVSHPIFAADGRCGPTADEILQVVTTLEVEFKYAGYVARERERAERLRRQANVQLAEDLPYQEFRALSYEAREKLARVRPTTLAQAARIPGVSPADLQSLLLEVRRLRSLTHSGGAREDE